MKGRKPSNPRVRDLAQGKLHQETAGKDTAEKAPADAKHLYPAPPAWMTDPNARAEWVRLTPELCRRKKYLALFEAELGRYCVNFGLYVDALATMRCTKGKRQGRLNAVTKSSTGTPMLSQHWVVANRAHEAMAKLAGDLGLNAVAYQRIESLQLDLFTAPPTAPDGDDGAQENSNVTAFGALRRKA